MTRVTYDTKAKRYTYQEKTVPEGEPIRLDIVDSYIYFSYHPTKKEYIMIDTPNRHEPDAKYVVIAPYCHWIWERNITVLALLSYAIQNAYLTRGNVQKAIKEAPSEEMLRQRIAEQECYTELVEIILTAITDLSEAGDLSVSHKVKVEKINGMIEFMRDKGVRPGCKTLTKETIFSDFITAGHDTETMNTARDIAIPQKCQLTNSSNNGKINMTVKQESETRINKENYWKSSGENTPRHPETGKSQRQARLSQWVTTPWEHQHTKRNSKLLTTNPMCQKSPQSLDQSSHDTEQMYPRKC